MKLKKNDKVLIEKGKDRGKTAKIDRVLVKTRKIILSGLNSYKKHLKPTQKNPHGGIVDIHMPVAISNVCLICPRCDKRTAINYKISKNAKIRICKLCQESLDNL